MWYAGNIRGEGGRGGRENDSGMRIPESGILGSQGPMDRRIQGAADHREYHTREI